MDGQAAAGGMTGGRPRAPRIDWAHASDAPAISDLLAQPLPGSVRMVLGDHVDGCVPRDEPRLRHHAIVVRDDAGRVLAHGARTVRPLRIGDGVGWVGYLHGLRRDPALAGDGLRLVRALARLRETRRTDEAAHDLTAILSSNSVARRVLEGGLPGAPAYHHLSDYRTVVLSTAAAARWTDVAVRICFSPAWAIDAVQRMVDRHAADYAPSDAVTTSWLTAWRGDRLVGAMRVVDRRNERREILAGYAPWLSAVRPALNPWLRLSGRPTLPAPGRPLSLAYASQLTVPDADPIVVKALLAAGSGTAQAQRLAVGLTARHPLSPCIDRLPAWRIDSRIYAVGACPAPSLRLLSPEAAWL
ncbi:MAG: hypothetical protein H0V44_09675 [Planctomycetes bacterium]|nr:hypothetical protein [Planctomycetota bacterium]